MLVEPWGAPTRSRPGREWSDEFDDAVRGLASGFLIGVPVVFTVDSWWLGDQNEPLDSLALLAFSYVLTLAVLALLAVFWVLGQIGDGQSPSIAVGRIAVAIGPVSLGVAVANHLLARDASRVDPDPGDASAMRPRQLSGPRRTLFELAASVAGALFVCLAIVPVDDLAAITTEVPLRNLPLVILLSLIVTYSVV